MDSFVILGLLVAVFLQFMPPQLCKEMQGFEGLHKDDDHSMDSRIHTNVVAKQRMKRDVDYSYPLITYLLSNTKQIKVKNSNTNCVEHFCENVPDYPLERINNSVQNVPSHTFHGIQGNLFNITIRQSNENGTALCFTKQRIIFPQIAINIDGRSVFIVNHAGKQQGVVITTCSNKKKNVGCGSGIRVNFPIGHEAICAQRTSEVNLIAYDPESADGIGVHTFAMPSCCVCLLKSYVRR